MKTLIIIIISLVITSISFADEKIVKIADNNVEVTKSKTLKDINDVDFEVWGEPESYGQDAIDKQLISAKAELISANKFDAVAYKQGLIDKANAKILKLQNIQTEMDKALQ